MSLPDSTRQHLETSNLAAIENEWLERVDDRPQDVDYFAAVAGALVDAGEAEEARTLLRLLDEELDAGKLWSERLQLLLVAGALYLKPSLVYSRVVETVEHLHADSASLPEMIKISGLNRATTDLRTMRLQVERLESLMELDVGSVVHMQGKGVGRIAEINFELGSYKIDFERHSGLTVGFKAGAKLLEPLPLGHVLRTKIEDVERLERLRDEDPSELLRETLQSYSEPLTASEIRTTLDGVVAKNAWARWWSTARRHPQVLVTTDKRQRYHWAESSQEAFESLFEAFESSDLAEQLDLFSKNARQNPELASHMADSLSETAGRLCTNEPERAIEIWMALDRLGLADVDATFSPASVIGAIDEIPSLLANTHSRSIREAMLDAVLEVRSEDWQEIYADAFLVEPDVALVGKIANAFEEKAPERLKASIDSVLSQPQRYPAGFLWLAQLAGRDDALRRAHASRLFLRLLTAVGRREFSPYRSTLDALLESGSTLAKLIGELDSTHAEAAEAAVERASLEDYVRQPLLNALHLRFPELRSETGTALYALRESIEQREEEARLLLSKEIPANRKAIQEAAALGDLRENFEYKSARERHEYLSARLGKLQGDLSRARPIDFSLLDGSEVRVGATVELEAAKGPRRTLTILGPWESDPENDLVSYLSDLGQSLIESKTGDAVAVDGTEYEIIAIRPYRDS